jgi:hypothetical protein
MEIAHTLKARAAEAFVGGISRRAAENATRMDRKAAPALRASENQRQAGAQLESMALGKVTAQTVSSAFPIV